MKWDAKWIWDDGQARPRNYWLCFRKEFYSNDDINCADFHITADSRYFLYINGHFVGQGPIRSWPHEQYYDTYDIKHLLVKGKNIVAVLVTHYGVSNFQYIEGRGGLFAQLELVGTSGITVIGTDCSWKNRVHSGYKRNSMRISCQMAWAEIFDAQLFDRDWVEIDYDDTDWVTSVELGRNGIAPWTQIQRRDIPHLREDIIYPARVHSLRIVKPCGQCISIDLEPYFFPHMIDCTPRLFSGFICSIIHCPEKLTGKLYFPWSRWRAPYGSFRINDRFYMIEGEKEEVSIELDKGENFFLMDVSGAAHGYFTYLHFDISQPVTFEAPNFAGFSFLVIGPFYQVPTHGLGEIGAEKTIPRNNEFDALWNSKGKEELNRFRKWIKPVAPEHICCDNVYTDSVYATVLREVSIPSQFNNMIIPNCECSVVYPDRKGDVEITLDFGKEVSGFIELDLDTSENTTIDFYGIEYIGTGDIVQHTKDMHCTLRYVTAKGRQSYRSVIRRGFRYLKVMVRGAAEPVKIYRIFVNLCTYPVANIGIFECSEQKLNRIWEISKHTAQLCMEDTYIDCPAHEQAFWIGDARNESLINYYVFGAYGISKHSLRLVTGSLKRSPLPESQVPSGWQMILMAWALFWITACREYYEHTADESFIMEIYPFIKTTINRLCEHINDMGLMEYRAWHLLDWAPMDTFRDGIMTHENAELVRALHDTAAMARWLGKEDEAKEYELIAKQVKASINQYMWDEKRQGYVDCIDEGGNKSSVISMQTNVMVYLCNCSEGEKKKKIEKYLLAFPESFVKIGSPFMSFFYLEALMKMDSANKILDYIRDSWGQMLDYGATTCWETFPGFEEGSLTRSHCHGWSAAPGYYLGAYVLGVRPLQPGFKKVLVDPRPGDLNWARGSIPIPEGRIDIAWEKTHKGLSIKVKGPKKIEYVFGKDCEVEDLKLI